MSKLRKTVRDLHRRGTEAYGFVEHAAGEFATVRLTTRTGARYTNLPVIGRVAVGDKVIIDFSLADRPYVRPITVIEDVVVQEELYKAQETVDPPLVDIFYSSTVGARGMDLWNQVRLPGWFYAEDNYDPPDGWYEIDFDDTGPDWHDGVDVATYGYNAWELAYMANPDKIPGAKLIGEALFSGAINQQVLIRTQFYIEELYGLPTIAILRYDYDDRLYAMYLNGTQIAGPDMTAEPGPGKPNGPWEIEVSQLLVTGKNVIAVWEEEGSWSIWPWDHKLQCVMWKLTTNLKSLNSEVLQDESVTTIRALDTTGTSLAPYSSGSYIPSFDSVEWGDEAHLEENPAALAIIGLDAGNTHVFLGNILGKYVVSVTFNVSIPDASSYPKIDDLFVYVIWTYPSLTGYTRQDWTYAARDLYFPDGTTTVPVSFSAHFAVSEASSYMFPRILRGSSPTTKPDTLVISDLKFDVMMISEISPSPRSTYGSHWDEWYEKYPDEL